MWKLIISLIGRVYGSVRRVGDLRGGGAAGQPGGRRAQTAALGAGDHRAIAALEQRFGTRLVERTTRRLAPTEAGVRLLERAQQLLQDYQAVVQDTAEAQLSGLLRVTSPVQFGRRYVAPVVMAFLDDYPQMQIEMVLNDRNLDLIDEGLDIAVRIGHLQDSSRVARRLGQVSRVTVASPAYLARCGEPRSPAQLAEHATIVGTQRPSLREWRFGPQENGERVRLAPAVAQRCGSAAAGGARRQGHRPAALVSGGGRCGRRYAGAAAGGP